MPFIEPGFRRHLRIRYLQSYMKLIRGDIFGKLRIISFRAYRISEFRWSLIESAVKIGVAILLNLSFKHHLSGAKLSPGKSLLLFWIHGSTCLQL